jgi:predicted dehydrogenase
MKKVNIGILGYGFVESTFHMPCYREIAEANVVAVGGRRKALAEDFAKNWNVKKVYAGENFIEELCADPEIEVVDIGLPNFLHKKAALLAVQNGKHVICEKPLARDVDESREMLEAVEKAKVIDCYAENQLFIPHVIRAKEIIERDTIGRIFWIRSREAHFGPHSEWFWNPELAGGGVLMDMGCHSLEVARHLIGRKPKEAFAWGDTLVHRDKTKAEDNSLALIKYEGDNISQSENSWAAHGGLDIRIEIYGSDGAVFLDVTRETGVKVFTVASEEKTGYIAEKAEVKKGWMYPIWREHEIYGYLFELKHFISCILEDQKPMETFRDGHIVQCMLESCYKSIHSNKWESIRI